MKVLNYYGWVLVLMMGCTSMTAVGPVMNQDGLLQQKPFWGSTELANRIVSQVKIKKEIAVIHYLETLKDQLLKSSPELSSSLKLADSPGQITLIESRSGKNKSFNSYSLPGNKIYLSVDWLRKTQFENEVAALLAIQLGYLFRAGVVRQFLAQQNSVGLKQFESLETSEKKVMWKEWAQKVELFGSTGLFSFSEEDDVAAYRTAVGILYRAGYDVRGVVTILELFHKNLEVSPYSQSRISELQNASRREIAMYSPLRNPIIRSQSYILIQKRIQQL